VPVKVDTEEHIIQPKTTASTPAAAAAAAQNPYVRRATAIDRYSRVVFPVVFTTFSITYWAVYINTTSSVVIGRLLTGPSTSTPAPASSLVNY